MVAGYWWVAAPVGRAALARGLPRPALVTRVEGARQQLHPGIPGIHQLTELRAIPEETRFKFMSQQKAKDSSDVNKG